MDKNGNASAVSDAGVIHVYPLFGREHVTDGTAPCWCQPEPDTECPNVLIHHSEQ